MLEESICQLSATNLTYRQKAKVNKDIRQILQRIIQQLKIHSFQGSPNLFKNENELLLA